MFLRARSSKSIIFDEDSDWVWPFPLAPDENGHYVYRDLIAVKCPLMEELQRLVEAKERGEAAPEQARQEFYRMVERDERGAGIPDELIPEQYRPRK